MTTAQLQGLSCLGGGALGSLIAYAYTDMLVMTGAAAVNPVLIFAPVVTTGFVIGCNVAAIMAPGLYWLHVRLP